MPKEHEEFDIIYQAYLNMQKLRILPLQDSPSQVPQSSPELYSAIYGPSPVSRLHGLAQRHRQSEKFLPAGMEVQLILGEEVME